MMATQVKTDTVEFTSRYHRKTYLVGDGDKGFRRVEFRNGYFSTDDAELIDWLCSHRDFNNEIFRTDAPGAYVPVDDSVRIIGGDGVANSKSKVMAARGSKSPTADNTVVPDPVTES